METPKTVKYVSNPSQDQVNFGGCDDPTGILEIGKEYDVERWDIHSWHTKVILKDFPNKGFNSVSFEFKRK